MGDRRKSGPGGDGAKAPLLPIYLEDHTDLLYGTKTLWPADGNSKRAAEQLHKPTSTSVKDPAMQATVTTARNLDLVSETFRDTLHRKPNSQLVTLELLTRLQEDPSALFIDHLKWDLNTPDALFALYVSRVAADLGLSHRAAIQIEDELRLLAHRARKDLAAGKRKPEARSAEGAQVRPAPAKRPMVLRGEAARQLIEKFVAKREAHGGKRAATPDLTAVSPPQKKAKVGEDKD